jgi:hypothetical protein
VKRIAPFRRFVLDETVVGGVGHALGLSHRPTSEHARVIRQRVGFCVIGTSIERRHTFVLESFEVRSFAGIDELLQHGGVATVDTDMNNVLGGMGSVGWYGEAGRKNCQRGKSPDLQERADGGATDRNTWVHRTQGGWVLAGFWWAR